ncbi:MAG: hypothetical protein IJ946_00865 [Clostridia bacterium]|nr:hypothetical protein [Clostridia bacterium]
MGYYSDPTANLALSKINKEFSAKEKRAKRLKELLKEGKITEEQILNAQGGYKGLYRHVLTLVLEAKDEDSE